MDNALVIELEDAVSRYHKYFDLIKKYHHSNGGGLASIEIVLKLKSDDEVKQLLEILK